MQDKQSLRLHQNKKGITLIVVLIVGIVVIVAASAGAYYFLKVRGQAPAITNTTLPLPVSKYQAPSQTFNLGGPTSTPLGKSDTTTNLNQDLNNTMVSSPSTDLQDLNNSASSL